MVKDRAYGHKWEDRGWLPIVSKGWRGWEQLLTCERCQGTRRDIRARATLKLVRRTYDLPDSYPGDLSQHDALKILTRHDAEMRVA